MMMMIAIVCCCQKIYCKILICKFKFYLHKPSERSVTCSLPLFLICLCSTLRNSPRKSIHCHTSGIIISDFLSFFQVLLLPAVGSCCCRWSACEKCFYCSLEDWKCTAMLSVLRHLFFLCYIFYRHINLQHHSSIHPSSAEPATFNNVNFRCSSRHSFLPLPP